MKRPAAVFGFTVYLVSVFLCGGGVARTAAALAFFAALFFISAPLRLVKFRRSTACLIVLLVAVSGLFSSACYIVRYALDYAPAVSAATDAETEIEGYVSDVGGYQNGRYTYIVHADRIGGEKTDCRLRLSSDTDLYLKPGECVICTVPAVERLDNGEYARYYLSEGVYLGAHCGDALRLTGEKRGGVAVALASIRRTLKERILSTSPDDSGGALCGVVLGDSSSMSPHTRVSFARCGINHIFAVSGFHVSAWSLFPYYLLALLHLPKRARAVIAALFALIVCAVTGFSPSALRSALMLCIAYFGSSLRLDGDMLNSLGISLSVMCFIEPMIGGSVSLLLSVTATFGIVLFASFVAPRLQEILHAALGYSLSVRLLQAIGSVLLLSTVVAVVLMPLSVRYFGFIAVFAPLSNLLLVPLTEFAMLTGGVGALCNSRFLIGAACRLCAAAIRGADLISSSSVAILRTELSVVLAAFFFACAVCLFVRIVRDRRLGVCAFLTAFALLTSSIAAVSGFARQKNVTVAVSAGYSPVVSIGCRGREALICGGSAEYGFNALLEDRYMRDPDVLLLFETDGAPPWTDACSTSAIFLACRTSSLSVGGDVQIAVDEEERFCTICAGSRTVLIVFDRKYKPEPNTADLLIVGQDPTDAMIDAARGGRILVCSELKETELFHW